MTKKALIALAVAVLFCGLLASSILADSGIRRNRADSKRPETVNGFNINAYPQQSTSETPDAVSRNDGDALPYLDDRAAAQIRRPLGATSTNAGEGVGESIDLTFNDFQMTFEAGRQVAHWYNGLTGDDAKVSVHFTHIISTDTLSSPHPSYNDAIVCRPTKSFTGYNVYDATAGGDWPVGQDDGCQLQITDTAGAGTSASLDMMDGGRVVIGGYARTAIFHPASERIYDHRIYYQGTEFSCIYNPYTPINVSWVDSSVYRDAFIETVPDAVVARDFLRDPQVMTQWNGTNTIVHLLAGEDAGGTVITSPPGFGTDPYWVWLYFQKTGDIAGDGTWQYMKPIDTINWVNMMLAVADYPNQGVACIYANKAPNGVVFNTTDRDIFCRESIDRGVTWQNSYNVTHYDNASEGSTNRGMAFFEAHGMFDSDGNLHAYFLGMETSADPYHDGFFNNYDQFTRNLYHWSKSDDNIVKVANGNFQNADQVSGGINRLVCGFGGSNAGYLSWATMGECDGKLYLAWSQIHERANYMDWQNALTQPAPGILDDCSHEGNRGGMANWDVFMTVARLESSSCWDYRRNITNTYRPDCGLAGSEQDNVCASEWKPQMEKIALDESGLTGLLTWPEAAKVDMTPPGDPAYTGGWYLNMQYMDDQYPGPAYWGGSNSQGTIFRNPPPTWNSEKWVRLACVEPIEVPRIAAVPLSLDWPEWVPFNTTESHTVTVTNEGNMPLNITHIGTFIHEPAGSWLTASVTPTPEAPFVVDGCVNNTETFNININTAGMSVPTWLNGYVWLKSDAANNDSLVIQVSVLAADTVEPVYWDTVMTHPNMLHPFFAPVGACVALAVGNTGELGYGAGSDGRVGLDYQDASTMPSARRECDTTLGKNRVCLVSATPYVILANSSAGAGGELTQVFNDLNQADETGFDPTATKGSLVGGVNAVKGYDSVYTGKFVNRDTTIAMERIVYGPRSTHPVDDIINFMIVHTKVYSADGLPHNHVTIGNAADFDVSSDEYNHNLGGLVPGSYVYMQGTDTTNHTGCASNVGRYATEVFGGGYTSAEFDVDPCANNTAYKGASVVNQLIMIDTSLWGSTPVTPAQPNPLVWWNTASVGGLSVVEPMPDTGRDLATFLTYKYDYSLGATETLNFWTVMTTTPRGGTLAELTAQVGYAKRWYTETVRGCSASCCVDRVGDANMSLEAPPDEISLGDIMLLVDVKFISGDCTKLTCILEADVNQDGGANPTCDDHVTLGDIMTLVDFLFITGPQNAVLKTCL